jgi:hypothetical protein
MGTQRDEAMERMVADTNDVQMFFMEKFSRLTVEHLCLTILKGL